MIGKGPIGGKAIETGLVIAGRNAVSVDSVGATCSASRRSPSSTSARPPSWAWASRLSRSARRRNRAG